MNEQHKFSMKDEGKLKFSVIDVPWNVLIHHCCERKRRKAGEREGGGVCSKKRRREEGRRCTVERVSTKRGRERERGVSQRLAATSPISHRRLKTAGCSTYLANVRDCIHEEAHFIATE